MVSDSEGPIRCLVRRDLRHDMLHVQKHFLSGAALAEVKLTALAHSSLSAYATMDLTVELRSNHTSLNTASVTS